MGNAEKKHPESRDWRRNIGRGRTDMGTEVKEGTGEATGKPKRGPQSQFFLLWYLASLRRVWYLKKVQAVPG